MLLKLVSQPRIGVFAGDEFDDMTCSLPKFERDPLPCRAGGADKATTTTGAATVAAVVASFLRCLLHIRCFSPLQKHLLENSYG